jgi:hypothetical protein
MAKAHQLDFTNVKEGGNFSKRHQPAGDYLGKIIKVADAKSKSDGVDMWLYTIEVNGATYPLYCKLQENQLWKVRNLFVAAGKNVPKKRVNVDPNSVVGRPIGVTLEDEEYEGKMQSVVQATFPTSELDPSSLSEGDGDDDDDDGETSNPATAPDDDDDEEEAPKPKKSKKGKKGKKTADDSELEELDVADI